MQFIDQSVLNFFAANRVEWLSFAMLVITYSGSCLVVTGVTLLSAASFYIHKHISKILPLLVSVAGSGITTFILKNIFDRARPFLGQALYTEASFSFPSGHATAAIALYGFLLYAVWKHDRHHLKNPFIILLVLLIALIGFSRLYLGVHYLSDVLVGYLVGFVWLILSIKLEEHLSRFRIS